MTDVATRLRPGRSNVLAGLAGCSTALIVVLLAGVPAAALGLPVGLGVGAVVRRWLARSASTSPIDVRNVPLTLDLLAAALRAGAPLAVAVGAVARAVPGEIGTQLQHTARLLDLGADEVDAWNALAAEPSLAAVARMAARSARSGIRLADGFERLASELRAELRTSAINRAQRVGIFSLIPLGICFLPAFVVTGIVPVVVGIAGDAFRNVSR